MPPRPYVLAETNWKSIKDAKVDVAILPWGATEPHNYHLPYATDVFESTFVAERSAEIAWKKGTKVVVLPTVPFGVNTGQLDLKLTLSINPSTQFAILRDVTTSLAGQGIRKCLILNSHGGNDFRQMIRELQPSVDLFLCTINWWTSVKAADFFDEPGDHAGEMETAMMMVIQPDLILPLSEAGDGAARRFRLKGLREGWVWAPRKWTSVTKDTGTGNPRAATREKGEKFIDAVTTKIAGFLTELAAADINDLYE